MSVETLFAHENGGYNYVSRGDDITVQCLNVAGEVMDDYCWTYSTAGKEQYEMIKEMVGDITETEEAMSLPVGLKPADWQVIEESVRLHVSKHYSLSR